MVRSKSNAWRSIADADIAKSPLNLRDGIGAPIHGDHFHLVGWERLRNSMSTASAVMSFEVPVALGIPERIEAADLR